MLQETPALSDASAVGGALPHCTPVTYEHWIDGTFTSLQTEAIHRGMAKLKAPLQSLGPAAEPISTEARHGQGHTHVEKELLKTRETH